MSVSVVKLKLKLKLKRAPAGKDPTARALIGSSVILPNLPV